MLRKFVIKNLRGIQTAELDGLDRINLIVGKNNTGKTAILEGLFLSYGPTNPQLALTLMSFRGVPGGDPASDEFWGWLFHRMDFSRPISLVSEYDEGRREALTIRASEPRGFPTGLESLTEPSTVSPSTSPTRGPRDLVFEYVQGASHPLISKAALQGLKIEFIGVANPPRPGAYKPTRHRNTAEVANQFSQLTEVMRTGPVLDAMRVIEPKLEDLQVLAKGPQPLVYADVGMSRLIPVQYMGEGCERVLEMVLEIASCEGGAVFFDEIENGLHHSVMRKVWLTIERAAKVSQVQVFATSHSLSCIEAASDAFDPIEPFPFRLYRLEKTDKGLKTISYDKTNLAAAISSDLELR